MLLAIFQKIPKNLKIQKQFNCPKSLWKKFKDVKYAGYGKTFTSESDILENCTEDPDFEPLFVLLEETGTTSD